LDSSRPSICFSPEPRRLTANESAFNGEVAIHFLGVEPHPMKENKMKILTAELKAINLWDRMFMDQTDPDAIDYDACTARMFRRVQMNKAGVVVFRADTGIA
jgi:hypothetical protein